MKKSPRKGDFFMQLKCRLKESINVSTAAMGIFNFLMISQKKWISKLFLILCSIKKGKITLYRAGEYFLS